MTITLTPEIESLLNAEVSAGRYASIEAAIEASVMYLTRSRDFQSDHELLDKIDQAEDAIERGEGCSPAEVRAKLSATIGRKIG